MRDSAGQVRSAEPSLLTPPLPMLGLEPTTHYRESIDTPFPPILGRSGELDRLGVLVAGARNGRGTLTPLERQTLL